MPPLPPVSNACQLTVRYTVGGMEAVNVLGGYWSEAADVSAAEANRWLGAWWSAIRGQLSNEVVCTGATLRDRTVVNGRTVDVGPPTANQGALMDPLALAAACFVVKWSTAFGGRRAKGRTFIPGVHESAMGSNGRTLNAGTIGTLQTNITTLYVDAMHPLQGNVAPAVVSQRDAVARQITAGSIATTAGIQRRRMR